MTEVWCKVSCIVLLVSFLIYTGCCEKQDGSGSEACPYKSEGEWFDSLPHSCDDSTYLKWDASYTYLLHVERDRILELLPFARKHPASPYSQLVFLRLLNDEDALAELIADPEASENFASSSTRFDLVLLGSMPAVSERMKPRVLEHEVRAGCIRTFLTSTLTVPPAMLDAIDGVHYQELKSLAEEVHWSFGFEYLCAASMYFGLGVTRRDMAEVCALDPDEAVTAMSLLSEGRPPASEWNSALDSGDKAGREYALEALSKFSTISGNRRGAGFVKAGAPDTLRTFPRLLMFAEADETRGFVSELLSMKQLDGIPGSVLIKLKDKLSERGWKFISDLFTTNNGVLKPDEGELLSYVLLTRNTICGYSPLLNQAAHLLCRRGGNCKDRNMFAVKLKALRGEGRFASVTMKRRTAVSNIVEEDSFYGPYGDLSEWYSHLLGSDYVHPLYTHDFNYMWLLRCKGEYCSALLPLARSFPESVYAQVVFVRVLEPKNAMKECFRAQELFDPWTYPLFELFLLTSVSEPVEGIFDDFLRLQKHMPYVDFIVSTTDTVPEGILAILDGHTFEEIGASEEMLAAISYINGLGVSYEDMKHVCRTNPVRAASDLAYLRLRTTAHFPDHFFYVVEGHPILPEAKLVETALDELEKVRELRRFGVDKFAVDFGSSDTTRFVHNRLETFAALSTSSDGAPLIRAICSVVIDGEFPPQKAMEDVVQEIGDLLDVELPQLSSDSPELTSRKAFSFAAMVLQTTPVTGKFTRGGGSIDDTLYLANQLAHQILLKGSHLENRNLFEVKMQAILRRGIFAD